MRLRRHGSTAKAIVAKPTIQQSNGYVLERNAAHPLAADLRGAYVYQHRRVFFDAFGAGPFSCFACGREVGWKTMHVDHVNDVPEDNRIENLRASCPGCNLRRGTAKMRATMRARHARRLEAFGRVATFAEWADEIGISRQALRGRLAAGWSIERALSEKRGLAGPRVVRGAAA